MDCSNAHFTCSDRVWWAWLVRGRGKLKIDKIHIKKYELKGKIFGIFYLTEFGGRGMKGCGKNHVPPVKGKVLSLVFTQE